MNTYQFTAVCRQGGDTGATKCVVWVDGENLEEARKLFRVNYPEDEWAITGEELVRTEIPERDAEPEPGERRKARVATIQRLELKTNPDIKKLAKTLNEPGNIVIAEEYPQGEAARLREKAAKLEEELEEQRYQRVEAGRKLTEARQKLAKAQEEAEAQAVRAERAEDEVVRLKAELYDYMTAAKQ